MHLDEVNFLAVILATVLAFVLGAAWYSPLLFGRQWMAANGYTEDRLKEMQAGAGKLYGISAVCWFVMATVLALVAPHFGEGVGAMLHMALLLWFGFAATTRPDQQPLLGPAAPGVDHRRRLPDRGADSHVDRPGAVALTATPCGARGELTAPLNGDG